MIRHVIWDWNGTLLDDVEHAIAALNHLLDARSMPRIDRARYRERFGFPVRSFYDELGFDFAREDFAAVSESFIARYRIEAARATTCPGVRDVMDALRAEGVRQSVLSAMELRMLEGMLRAHGVRDHLEHVRGLDDLHATSKVALGVRLMRELSHAPEEVLFIGDTLHDHETASAMGCRCLLYAHGHQSAERLAGCGAPVFESFDEVLAVVRGETPARG